MEQVTIVQVVTRLAESMSVTWKCLEVRKRWCNDILTLHSLWYFIVYKIFSYVFCDLSLLPPSVVDWVVLVPWRKL